MSLYIPEEWELIDDDGFIYKRRKKINAIWLDDDNDETLKRKAEERLRIQKTLDFKKKKAMLEAQKAKYQAEIEDWERLLNRKEAKIPTTEPAVLEPLEATTEPDSNVTDRSLIELKFKVEKYEKFIALVEKQCELGDRLCENLEKAPTHEKQRLVDEVAMLARSPSRLISWETTTPPGAMAVSTEVGRLLADTPR